MADIAPRSELFGRLDRFKSFNDDDWFKGFWMRPLPCELEDAPQIKLDLTENGNVYTVRVEIPGARKEDIKVQVDGKHVSISAEIKLEMEEKKGDKIICWCYHGSSYRSFTLDCEVDEDKAQAKYEYGLLELKLPKKDGRVAKQLQIT